MLFTTFKTQKLTTAVLLSVALLVSATPNAIAAQNDDPDIVIRRSGFYHEATQVYREVTYIDNLVWSDWKGSGTRTTGTSSITSMGAGLLMTSTVTFPELSETEKYGLFGYIFFANDVGYRLMGGYSSSFTVSNLHDEPRRVTVWIDGHTPSTKTRRSIAIDETSTKKTLTFNEVVIQPCSSERFVIKRTDNFIGTIDQAHTSSVPVSPGGGQ